MVSESIFSSARSILALTVILLVVAPAYSDESFDRDSLRVKDTLVLRSGVRLDGKFISEVKEGGRYLIVFEMDDGGVVKLDRSKLVSKLVKLDDIDKEYNRRIETIDDTAEAHWDICKWCVDQKSGRLRFKDQIKFHRERIMDLDPNDDKVKKLLGYEFVPKEGRWVPTKEYWASKGYEKNGTRWAPLMQRVASGQFLDAREVAGRRKSAFKRWKGDFRRKSLSRNALLNGLFQICDAEAINIILADAEKEKNPLLDELYVEAFGRVPTAAAMRGLIYFYMEYNSDRALTLLQQEHYPPENVAAVLSVFLRDTNNLRVRRAAFAIGELDAENVILPMIDALVTNHQIAPGKQAGRMSLSKSNAGGETFGVGGKSGPVKTDFRNVEVSDALRKITQQDFGYDTGPWFDWYVKHHTNHDLELRGARIR